MSDLNPALLDFATQPEQLPNFSGIKAAQIVPTLTHLLERNRSQLNTLLAQPPSWENLIEPLEAQDDQVERLWSVVSHLHNVCDTNELRQAYQQGLTLLTDYHTELAQNTELYHAYQAITDSDAFASFGSAQKTTIEHAIRDFKLSGVALPDSERKQFADAIQQVNQLSTQFRQNVLDATDGWHYLVTEPQQLTGLPEQTIAHAKTAAQSHQQSGWRLTLEMPCYFAVMTHADSSELRETIYRAYTTRASDQGPQARQWDNSRTIQDLIQIRQQMAALLGFDNYAQMALQSRMVAEPQAVIDFLTDLNQRARPAAEQQWQALQQFAKNTYQLEQLQPWDIAYVSEKMRQTLFDCDEEALRPYFPAPKVINGLFGLVQQLFTVQFKPLPQTDSWHPSVTTYTLLDTDQQVIGHLYMDLYARPHKNSGAWMSECRMRRRLADGQLQTPIAFLTCNFSSPVNDRPSLLSHEEVLTLFHECGHCLHHLLSQQEIATVSGMASVPWDAVELPSQMLEQWVWQKPVLQQLSCHVDTNQPLPDAFIDNLLATHTFQAALSLTRQLTYSLFDFELHQHYQVGTNIQTLLNRIRENTQLTPYLDTDRFQHSFMHIFAGGYAAGYYSYLWAEVLACDAFAVFEEQGLFDQTSGLAFRDQVLAQGGAIPPEDCFIAFRGRKPKLDAWLRHRGLTTGDPT